MNLCKLHYKTTIKKDLSSRFFYKNPNQITDLEKINLNIGIKDFILKKHLTTILLLEFITSVSPIVTKAKKTKISFNIKKNSPNGFKVSLFRKNAYDFLQKLSFYVLPNFKNQQNNLIIKNNDFISFSIKEFNNFHELTFFYSFFKTINVLDINLKLKSNYSKSNLELLFYLTSLKFPAFILRK